MALSCVIMANVGTYAKIGVISSWVVTFCRVAQGLSSMGEIIGAGIYLTETVKPPFRYPAVASVVIASTLGGTAALAVASLVTSYGFNWRLAFWIGGGIAVIGIIARTTLREAPDFVNAKKKIQDSLARINENITVLKDDAIFNEKINKKVLIFYFIMESTSPVYFYLNYIYCGNILKNTFFYTADQVIKQNFILGVANFLNVLILTFLCYKVHPIKILRYKLFIFIPFSIFMPYFLNIAASPSQVLLIQLLSVFFACTAFPANPVIYVYFPIFKRFSAVTFTFAISKAVMYTISSFGIMYLTKYFGNLGLLILILPLNLGYTMAINYFKNLERMNNNYH